MDLALVCIAKNEDPYIEEWVNYNLKLGFDKVFIYENNWRCKLNNDNIVKNITFLNKMEEFIKLININDSVVNDGVNTNLSVIDNLFKKNNNNTNVTFNEHYKRLIEILKLKLKESDIGKGINIDIESS